MATATIIRKDEQIQQDVLAELKWDARVHPNEIEVRLSTQQIDPDIANAVLHALEWDAGVPLDKIQVAVSKGWVTLKGEVEWQYQREDSEKVVRRISGVKGVSNLIVVKPRVSPTDLRKKIEEALVRSAQLDAAKITVEIQGST